MLEQGVTDFIELGPNNVLTGLLKRIDKTATGRALGTTAEVQEWLTR
jgi:[acyl-carrier-protein] S-malonyltransferase